MSNTELKQRESQRLGHTLADYDGPQTSPSRNVSLRDLCNLLLGALIGYMTLGW